MFFQGAKLLSFRLLILLQNALFWCFRFGRSKEQCGNSLPGTQSYKNVGRWLGVRNCFCFFLCTQDRELPHWSVRFPWVSYLPHRVYQPCALPKCGCSAALLKQGPSYISGSFSPQRNMTSGVDRRKMGRVVSL